MRMIGHLENEAKARVFSDYLYAKGIDNEIESDRSGAWALWVHDEDHVGNATEFLNQFRENPAEPKYQQAGDIAREHRAREAQKNEAARKRYFDRRKLFPAGVAGVGRLTAALVAVCVVVGIFSKLGADEKLLGPLFISDPERIERGDSREGGLAEIRRGEVWRLVTPILIHFGPIHLFFNMLWLLDLGTMVERRQSSRRLLALVLFIAAVSNLAQFIRWGPAFGGMSGVVYGLIGYIWLRGKYDPNSGLFLHHTTVTMAMIWFFACLVGVVPDVANTAHAAGLGVGMAWGLLSAMVARRG